MKIITKIGYKIFLIICLPYTFFKLIHEYILFKRNINILSRVVNKNEAFFEFLNKYGFSVDLLGRLYAPQTIPYEFIDFTEDELYDVTMRAFVTSLQETLNKNILLDVCGITVNRKRNSDIFLVNITSSNENILKNYFSYFIISLSLFSIIILLICIL